MPRLVNGISGEREQLRYLHAETIATKTLNHIRDAGSSRNFLDLGHEGPIPIADTLLVSEEEEEEVKEVKDKRSNIICLPTFF